MREQRCTCSVSQVHEFPVSKLGPARNSQRRPHFAGTQTVNPCAHDERATDELGDVDAEIKRVHRRIPGRAARDLAMLAGPLILNASVPCVLKIPILECAIELDPSDALAVALLACSIAKL